MFRFIANTAAFLSITSSAIEAGKKGLNDASKCAQTAVAIGDVKDITNDSYLNKPSEKHNAMKEFVRKHDLLSGTRRAQGAMYGFVTGIAKGIKGNLLSIGFSTMTLASKNKKVKTAGVIGTGISLVWDFIKNGTNLLIKRDVIEK